MSSLAIARLMIKFLTAPGVKLGVNFITKLFKKFYLIIFKFFKIAI